MEMKFRTTDFFKTCAMLKKIGFKSYVEYLTKRFSVNISGKKELSKEDQSKFISIIVDIAAFLLENVNQIEKDLLAILAKCTGKVDNAFDEMDADDFYDILVAFIIIAIPKKIYKLFGVEKEEAGKKLEDFLESGLTPNQEKETSQG